MRTFSSGATRDSDDTKIDLEGFISPIVLQAYGEYMTKHRIQPDGSLRDSDNWQKGFGDNHLDVCMKSGMRHFMDWWLEHRNYPSREGIDDALCGLLFNLQAYYKHILEERLKKNE